MSPSFSHSTAEPGARRDETPQCPPRSSVARRGLGFKVSSSAPCRAGCKKRRRRLEKDLWGAQILPRFAASGRVCAPHAPGGGSRLENERRSWLTPPDRGERNPNSNVSRKGKSVEVVRGPEQDGRTCRSLCGCVTARSMLLGLAIGALCSRTSCWPVFLWSCGSCRRCFGGRSRTGTWAGRGVSRGTSRFQRTRLLSS